MKSVGDTEDIRTRGVKSWLQTLSEDRQGKVEGYCWRGNFIGFSSKILTFVKCHEERNFGRSRTDHTNFILGFEMSLNILVRVVKGRTEVEYVTSKSGPYYVLCCMGGFYQRKLVVLLRNHLTDHLSYAFYI